MATYSSNSTIKIDSAFTVTVGASWSYTVPAGKMAIVTLYQDDADQAHVFRPSTSSNDSLASANGVQNVVVGPGMGVQVTRSAGNNNATVQVTLLANSP